VAELLRLLPALFALFGRALAFLLRGLAGTFNDSARRPTCRCTRKLI
jgi:hypothetical protein